MTRRPWTARAGAVAAGLALERVLPEPADRYHPVAWFGRAMQHVEDRLYQDGRTRGVLHTLTGAGLGAASGAALRRLLGPDVSTAITTNVTVGGRMLTDVATDIGTSLARGDLEAARQQLPALVGRDPSRLSESEIARAVVESVAENTVDAVVAPTLWAVVGGGIGAATYRAVNTMDAMVGHHDPRFERYGWAAARLDDLASWVPARAAAVIVVLLRPRRAGAVWRAVRADAPCHPSPNAGVVEAAFAAALGIRLGGTNRYGGRVEERARLGTGRDAGPTDIDAAVRLSRQVSLAMMTAFAVAAAAPSVVRALRGRQGARGSLVPWPATSSTRSG